MRTNLEFQSSAFPALPDEDRQVNPGRYGKALADFLASALPRYGLEITSVSAEDWGWRINLRNDAFPLWLGCGNYDEFENGFLCFIEPSAPFIRHWLKRIETSSTVERLATAVESVLRDSGKVANLRWWTEAETQRG
jgi:hypothetical protein